MAERRLLEDGVDLRLLEDASGRRLIEDGPNVAGGIIPFPGGYGFGSGGYGGGGPGSGGGGLAGGGQGGEGSGGGGGTGTTTTIRLPFKPGLVLFIATNQTLGGWRTYDSGTFHWTCTGIASWGAPDKSSIFNAAHETSYKAVPFDVETAHGSGEYHGYCIWIRESPHGADTALAHVSAFHADGFDLVWDAVGGAGYPIYFVAARDQKSWADATIGADDVILDGLTGGRQDGRPQGGFSFFHGDSRGGNGAGYSSYLASSVATWARPDQGNNFEPVGGTHAAKNNVFEQSFWIDFDADSDYHIDLPGNLNGIVMSPWIAGSLLQGWNSLYLTNEQVRQDFDSNEPMGFAWASGALNSCDSRFITPAASGEKVTELRYDFPPNESTFKPQMGFTYMRPAHDAGIAVGHSVGLWARMVEDDPTKDFHAIVACGRSNGNGRVVGYHGVGTSWMGEFSLASPGDVPAGRLEYRVPGEIVTHTDQTSSKSKLFMLWMNGVTVPRFVPSVYRRVRSY